MKVVFPEADWQESRLRWEQWLAAMPFAETKDGE